MNVEKEKKQKGNQGEKGKEKKNVKKNVPKRGTSTAKCAICRGSIPLGPKLLHYITLPDCFELISPIICNIFYRIGFKIVSRLCN